MAVNTIIFADDNISHKISSSLQGREGINVVGITQDENNVLNLITEKKADIILLSSSDERKMLRISQQIYLLRPRTTTVVMVESINGEQVHRFMQTGVHHVLPLGIDGGNLGLQLNAIWETENSRISALESTNTTTWKSKVITMFSACGGSGKSFIASNLAIELANRGRKVALLDLDLEFGSLDIFMKVQTDDTITDLIQELQVASADVIRKYMTVHASGVNILSAPSSPEFASHVTAQHVVKIISTLRNHYDYIVIDTASNFQDINLSVFDLSSIVFYVAGNDVLSLMKAKKSFGIFDSIVGTEKLRVVIGQEKASRIKPDMIPKVLSFPVFATIPHDPKGATESINVGTPIVHLQPQSSLSKAFRNIATLIDGTDMKLSAGKKKSKLSFPTLGKRGK